MFIDKKVTTWIRYRYDDHKVTAKELIENPDTDKGFTEREELFDCESDIYGKDHKKVVQIYTDSGKLIYKVEE